MLAMMVLDHLHTPTDGISVWGSAVGGYGSINGDGNAARVSHSMSGFLAGVDLPVARGLRAGIAGGYTNQTVHIDGRGSHATSQGGNALVYASWTGNGFQIAGGGQYGGLSSRVTRDIGALSQTDRDHQSGRVWQVFADAGYGIRMRAATIEPYAGVTHISARSGRFAENGSVSALSGAAAAESETSTTLGVRAAGDGIMLDGRSLTPKLDLGWRHSFDPVRPVQALTFTDTGQSFTVSGAPLERDAVTVKASLDWAISADILASVGYDGAFSSKTRDNRARASVSIRF